MNETIVSPAWVSASYSCATVNGIDLDRPS